MLYLKFKEKIANLQKKHIIYGILILVFLTVFIIYLVSRFVEGTFVEEIYDNAKGDSTLSYKEFLKAYVDSFFIYATCLIAILWIMNFILRAVKKRVTPDFHNAIKVIIRVTVIPFFIIAYLNKFPAFTGAIIGVAATIGIAFGLAASRYVGDIITGLYILFSKHHNIGDYLIIPSLNIEGIVKDISINYLVILQQGGTTSIIPNNKLKDRDIINIAVVKEEKSRDGISQLIMYGKKVSEVQYIYPLKWACNSDDSHEMIAKAIEETEDDFKDFLEEKVNWHISKRNRLDREYTIMLTVIESKSLLTLVPKFTKTLEVNYEKLKNKKR